tara:strand:+ start:144 stop:1496 length:1353 start_codon:yes stop_codon:yes gene_type:complete
MSLKIGKNFISQKNLKDAEKVFLDLHKTNNSLEINYNLGIIYFELKEIKKSQRFFEKCIKIDPKSINTYLKIAYLEQSTGDIEKSLSTYQKALNINKRDIRVYYGIFTLDPNFLKDTHYEIIKQINTNPKANIFEKFLSNFLLSKKEKNEKNFVKELSYLKDSHNLCFDFKKKYNLQSQKYYSKVILDHYNQSNFIENDKNNHLFNDISPIFIIGLPRSGSTLVEAIITSSDNKIPSFGESAFVNMGVIDQLSPHILSDNISQGKFDFKVNVFRNFVNKKYLQFSFIDSNVTNFVDKSLENFFNIEFILNIFPKAKFLHCHRNLKDSIIGIYQSLLPDLSWPHSIENIIYYIDNYKKIIDYFKKKYPDKVYDISLENLTKNKEEVSKEIFNFCNIKWSSDVLEFYKRKDLDIRTTSNIQIRNEITIYNTKKYSEYYYIFDEFQKKYSWLK